MPQTLHTDSEAASDDVVILLTSSPLSLILTLTLVRPEFFFSLSLVGSLPGLFSCFSLSLSLRFPPASHVEGSSLTTSLRYQDLRFFCNQLAYGRLVIRRAVEMENPRFVGLFVIVGTK